MLCPLLWLGKWRGECGPLDDEDKYVSPLMRRETEEAFAPPHTHTHLPPKNNNNNNNKNNILLQTLGGLVRAAAIAVVVLLLRVR